MQKYMDESYIGSYALSPKLKGLSFETESVSLDYKDRNSIISYSETDKFIVVCNKDSTSCNSKEETLDIKIINGQARCYSTNQSGQNRNIIASSYETLYSLLNNRFSGRKGNSNILKLVDLAKTSVSLNEAGPEQFLMIKELRNLLDFSLNRNLRTKVCSQFDLIETLRNNKQESMLDQVINTIECKHRHAKLKGFSRFFAIKRYLNKKDKRKITKITKYVSRSTFAANRPRFNGKFLSKPRVDIKQIVDYANHNVAKNE